MALVNQCVIKLDQLEVFLVFEFEEKLVQMLSRHFGSWFHLLGVQDAFNLIIYILSNCPFEDAMTLKH
jgi:hypothetical protein